MTLFPYTTLFRSRDGDIFIYDRKTGKGLKKINREGQGGEEYTFIQRIVLDENPVVLSPSQEAPSDSKLSWQEQKEQQAKERKRKNELKKTEDRIAVLEERNEEIDMLMTQEEVYSNSVKCQELALEKDANNNELEELYEKWEELAE